MSVVEDEDLRLQRAAASLQSQLEQLLPKLLKKRRHGLVPAQLMYSICGLIEPFQEDPQLLDAHLQTLLPPLVSAFLEGIPVSQPQNCQRGRVSLTSAICYILNLFCKVRGEKVIKGFLNNEPRYLEPMLEQIDAARKWNQAGPELSQQYLVAPWVERYVLLVWLSHLMLAPFPLESLSAPKSSADFGARFGIKLPALLPGATLHVLAVCFDSVQSASKERSAAAALLAKLSLRPDMQKLGLLHTLLHWALAFFEKASETQVEIHHCLGILSFLSNVVASADTWDVEPYVQDIYQTCQKVLQQDGLIYIKSSALARKLIVKLRRNIVTHSLRLETQMDILNETSLIEDAVEYFLEAVADGDSPVRYAASKALSVITLKLDQTMADEVIDAVLESLNESVYWKGSLRQLSGVNPLRWHGLTLTLSHLLYRKAISIRKLPEALNALLLSLCFEQRSPTGGSIGTNVRDAACFGIWALSRRYTSGDLLGLKTAAIRACEQYAELNVPQALAVELLTAACLDPSGNIRRGSSAALQELIGRHPNTVDEGISLVQIVDFHAVGLRKRAMCDVAIKAGQLLRLYWECLFQNLLGWRGICSLDTDTRLSAAAALGSLSKMQPASVLRRMSNTISAQLNSLVAREVEERQGLVTSLAAILNTLASAVPLVGQLETQEAIIEKQLALMPLWGVLDEALMLEDKAFTSTALRPELTASSIAHFIAALSVMSLNITEEHTRSGNLPVTQISRNLNLCLVRHEDSVLEAVKTAIPATLSLLSKAHCSIRDSLVNEWLSLLENEASYDGVRCSGHTIALGSAYSAMDNNNLMAKDDAFSSDLRRRIIRVLTFRCTAAVAIEARVVALRALNILVRTSGKLEKPIEHQLYSALHIALNDYTITERGDVGSLVRLEALDVVGSVWAEGVSYTKEDADDQLLYADVLRLSLERLDKARARAAEVLNIRRPVSQIYHHPPTDDVSSTTYFLGALQMLHEKHWAFAMHNICIGFASSAGLGSESVVQNARLALLQFSNTLPAAYVESVEHISLLEFSNFMVSCIKENLSDDRILIPLLEIIAFLFDMQVLHRLVPTNFNFRALLSLIQKAHFKTTQMKKLDLALNVYRSLGSISETRNDTLRKLSSMLLHPFAKIRVTAAETLWTLTQDDALLLQDWSLPSKKLKPAVDTIKVNFQAKSSSLQ